MRRASLLLLFYIDPGVGFVSLQVLLGALVGGAFYFRMRVLRLVSRLRSIMRLGRRDMPPGQQQD